MIRPQIWQLVVAAIVCRRQRRLVTRSSSPAQTLLRRLACCRLRRQLESRANSKEGGNEAFTASWLARCWRAGWWKLKHVVRVACRPMGVQEFGKGGDCPSFMSAEASVIVWTKWRRNWISRWWRRYGTPPPPLDWVRFVSSGATQGVSCGGIKSCLLPAGATYNVSCRGIIVMPVTSKCYSRCLLWGASSHACYWRIKGGVTMARSETVWDVSASSFFFSGIWLERWH